MPRGVLYEHNGEELTQTEWSKRLGIAKCTFGARVRRGLTGDALFSPCKLEYHGCSRSVTNESDRLLHRRWVGIKTRCTNPNEPSYKYYGGRGITICDEWIHSFSSFKKAALLAGYKSELEIDRIDNNKGYEPGNIRFVPKIVNARNKRNTTFIEHEGERLPLGVWAERLSISPKTIYARLRRGYPIWKVLLPRLIPHTERRWT